jgi:hypothetical protein
VTSLPKIDSDLLIRCIGLHGGPVAEPAALMRLLDRDIDKKARAAIWKVIDENQVSASIISQHGFGAGHSLARRAAAAVQSEGNVAFLSIACANSDKALDVAFDWMLEHARERFTSEWFAEIVLGLGYLPREVFSKIVGAVKPDELDSQRAIREAASVKTFRPRKVIRYAKLMIGLIGREKVLRMLDPRLLGVERRLRYVIDVWPDAKEKVCKVEDLDTFVEYFELVREIGSSVPDGLLETFAEVVGREDVTAKVGITPEAVASVRAFL